MSADARSSERVDRPETSAAVEAAGWRLILGTLMAAVPVDSLQQALLVAQAAVTACGVDADDHLQVDIRPDRVELSLRSTHLNRTFPGVSRRDVDVAHAIGEAIAGLGLVLLPPVGTGGSGRSGRPVQRLEICVDALDIAAVRPFWLAVLALTPEPGHDGPEDAILDPAGQLPAVWFQQMDEPRPQRNRIHFDIAVPHDEALRRVQAAVDAGGTVVDDGAARAFWILADLEGNEVCVCTWQDRD